MINKIQELIAILFADDLYTDEFESDVTIAAVPFQIVLPDPKRLTLWLQNNSANPLTISQQRTVTVSTGIILAPGEWQKLLWYEEFEQVARDWWGIASPAGGTVHVREVRLV